MLASEDIHVKSFVFFYANNCLGEDAPSFERFIIAAWSSACERWKFPFPFLFTKTSFGKLILAGGQAVCRKRAHFILQRSTRSFLQLQKRNWSKAANIFHNCSRLFHRCDDGLQQGNARANEKVITRNLVSAVKNAFSIRKQFGFQLRRARLKWAAKQEGVVVVDAPSSYSTTTNERVPGL